MILCLFNSLNILIFLDHGIINVFFNIGRGCCEKYNIIITDHRTTRENYVYWFDLIIKKLLKFIRGSKKKEKKDYEKIFFGKTKKTKRKKLKIMKEKPYDFDKMNNELLGTKRKIW